MAVKRPVRGHTDPASASFASTCHIPAFIPVTHLYLVPKAHVFDLVFKMKKVDIETTIV
jgi:hypothetical protein